MSILAEQHRQDAARHRANAARYMAAGQPEYAVGSMLKARRFEQRARDADYRWSSVFVVDELMRRGEPRSVAVLLARRQAAAAQTLQAHMARLLYGSAA